MIICRADVVGIIFLFVVVLFFGCLMYVMLTEQDNSKCSYKISGKLVGVKIANVSMKNVKGEISGEVYCRDIDAIIVASAKEKSKPEIIFTPAQCYSNFTPQIFETNFNATTDCWRCM